MKDQFGTGAYWDRHKASRQERLQQTARVKLRIPKAVVASDVGLLPWRTVRDAIMDLPDPKSRAARAVLNHAFQPGAKPYPGHTGSVLDLPAKTLKAGDHGVPGGENMIALPDGTYRYFTVRESARLQTFRDDYVFHGSWTETMRQLGNAVPVKLAHIVGASVAAQLHSAHEKQPKGRFLRRA